MRVGFLTFAFFHNKPDTGSSRIRAEWVARHWDGAELYRYGQAYDAMVYQKVYMLDHAKRFPGIKVFDICDPDWLHHQPVIEMIQECDAVTTSTQALADYLQPYVPGKPVVWIKDRIDFTENTQQKTEHREHVESVVWFGYAHNAKSIQSVHSACMKRGIKFVAIADQPIRDCDEWVEFDRETINDEIVKHDVVILPPPGGNVGRFKSENKLVNAWSLGMPVACYIDYRPGDEELRGELAHLTLEKLLSKEAREQEAANRLAFVKAEYDVKTSVAEYQSLIQGLQKASQ